MEKIRDLKNNKTDISFYVIGESAAICPPCPLYSQNGGSCSGFRDSNRRVDLVPSSKKVSEGKGNCGIEVEKTGKHEWVAKVNK